MDYYPMWTRQFPRIKEKVTGSWYAGSDLDAASHDAIKKRIEIEGPLSTRAFDTKITGKKTMWKRPPHKKALDYMWYCGELTTSHRKNFVKFYDLTHRVIPAHQQNQRLADHEQIDWLCRAALDRMSFGTLADIQKFWDATSRSEVKKWVDSSTSLRAVEIEGHDGKWTEAFAPENIENRLAHLRPATSRLRVINPFDPAIRDRNRLKRLFGMDYKIEIFVPASKRLYGYYVYPLLEGDRFIGRIDLKADRKKGIIYINQIWLEPKTKWTAAKAKKLDSELERLARFIGVIKIKWNCKV